MSLPAHELNSRGIPDYCIEAPSGNAMLQIWSPDEEIGGLATLDFVPDTHLDVPSPFPGINPVSDVDGSARTHEKLTAVMPHLYAYLGVSTQRTANRTTLAFPHINTLSRKLNALPLGDDSQMPEFIAQPEGLYESATFLGRIVQDRAFILADEDGGPYNVHDLTALQHTGRERHTPYTPATLIMTA